MKKSWNGFLYKIDMTAATRLNLFLFSRRAFTPRDMPALPVHQLNDGIEKKEKKNRKPVTPPCCNIASALYTHTAHVEMKSS